MNLTHVFYGVAALGVTLLCLYLMGFKNWLVYAVTQAETLLGGNTGQLKLRLAYDMAVEKYAIVAKIMPYPVFDWFVRSALKTMNKMLTENKTIEQIVRGSIEEGETNG